MSGCFAPGERAFLTAGIEVLEARAEHIQYGRYVISYEESGYGREGRMRSIPKTALRSPRRPSNASGVI